MNKIQPLEKAAHVLGGRWRTTVVHFLKDGPKRFSDLLRETGISRGVLTANLRALEEAGLVSRTAYPEIPPRVEYGLTPEGMALRPLIDCLCSWGQKFEDRQRATSVAPSTPFPVE